MQGEGCITVDKLEQKIEDVKIKINGVEIKINDIEAKIAAEEAKVPVDRIKEDLEAWRRDESDLRRDKSDLHKNFDTLYNTYNTLINKQIDLKTVGTKAEDMFPEYEKKVAAEGFFTLKSETIPLCNRHQPSNVFVRQCYTTYGEIILSKIKMGSRFTIVVTGNPGIGKSLFYCYCVRCVLQDKAMLGGKTFVINVDNIYYKLVVDAHGIDWFVEVPCNEVRGSDSIRFVDGFSDHLMGWSGSTVLYASPSLKNKAKDLAKQSNNVDRSFLHMPCWDLAELNKGAKFVNFNKNNLRKRFLIVGGVPRRIFGTSTLSELKKSLNATIDSSSCMDHLLLAIQDNKPVIDDYYSDELLRMVPPEDIRLTGAWDFTLEFHSEWIAPKAMDSLFLTKYSALLNFALTYINVPSRSIWVGRIYEGFIHRRFADNSFTLRGIELGGSDPLITEVVPTEPFIFDNLKEVTLKRGTPQYFRPRSQTFASLDSLYWNGTNCYILKMTNAQKHDINNEGIVRFINWYHKLGVGGEFYFVFVVPLQRLDHWKRMNKGQKLVKPGCAKLSDAETAKIRQYVAGLGFTNNENWQEANISISPERSRMMYAHAKRPKLDG